MTVHERLDALPGGSRPTRARAHVTVLLGLYQGEAHLSAQLASLARQSHRDWSLIVGDDGSTDNGPAILLRFARRYPERRVAMIPGPGEGFARNFLSLIDAAGPQTPFVAFCDQDDVWYADRLSRALRALAEVPAGQPGLYCGRTLHCDAALRPLSPSPRHRRSPEFGNALVQSLAGGNTMVLNRAAVDLAQRANRRIGPVVSHDWWLYQLVTGAGGHILYDPVPSLLYRQHETNAVGARDRRGGRRLRLRKVWNGRFRAWNDLNLTALTAVDDLLTEENRLRLARFRAARRANLAGRLIGLARSRVHRQARRDTLCLWAAAALDRV